MRGVDQLAVLRIGLGALDDAAHHRDRGLRMLAGGGFGRQHDGVRAVVDGGGHVGGLGARGHGALDHGFQHLRGDDHRLAGAAAAAHGALLDRGHLFGRQFHAQVAARHHQRVGLGDDLVQPLDRRGLLQLGDDAGAVADPFAGLDDVLGRCTKDSAIQSAPSASAVSRSRRSWRERGDRQHHARHVDALAFGQPSAHQHPGIRAGRVAGVDAQAQAAVVQQQLGAGRQRGEDLGGRQTRSALPGRGSRSRRKRWPGCNCTGPCAKAPTRSLGLAGRPSRRWGGRSRPRSRAQDGHADRVILGAAVAEVQPEHVHAGMEQAAEGIAVAAGRTQRGDDLGAAVAA